MKHKKGLVYTAVGRKGADLNGFSLKIQICNLDLLLKTTQLHLFEIMVTKPNYKKEVFIASSNGMGN